MLNINKFYLFYLELRKKRNKTCEKLMEHKKTNERYLEFGVIQEFKCSYFFYLSQNNKKKKKPKKKNYFAGHLTLNRELIKETKGLRPVCFSLLFFLFMV